ncbi:hypothetical protein ACS0TY_016261 [Phlomoides rotata]
MLWRRSLIEQWETYAGTIGFLGLYFVKHGTVQVGETMCIFEALSWAKNLNLEKVVVEDDAKIVVDAVTSRERSHMNLFHICTLFIPIYPYHVPHLNFYHSAILSHTSLESALSNLLSIKLCNTDVSLSSDALNAVFLKALIEDREIQRSIRDDRRAVKDRDPASLSYTHCFLNFKGFLAIQAHRLGHKFWLHGWIQLAILIQNRVSEVFSVDNHPGAGIGSAVVFDHGTGIIIGETTIIRKGVMVLRNVTLGGTGKGGGDRHPKIGDGVMIGAGAKVLGNIKRATQNN